MAMLDMLFTKVTCVAMGSDKLFKVFVEVIDMNE